MSSFTQLNNIFLKPVQVHLLISEFAGLPSYTYVHMKLLELEKVNI